MGSETQRLQDDDDDARLLDWHEKDYSGCRLRETPLLAAG